MNWDTIIALGGLLGGWETIKYFLNRRSNRRLAESNADKAEADADTAEWHLYKEQLETMNEQCKFKDERIADLLRMNAEKEDRFVEQTDRLRQTQQRELDANNRIIELTQKNAALELQIKDEDCIRLGCRHRDPPNEHTKRAMKKALESAETFEEFNSKPLKHDKG